MNSLLFHDNRTTGLMNRVREDVSNLRDDIRHLLSYTTRQTLPNGARELADQAKQQLASSGAQVASRIRDLNGRQSAGLIGGAMVIGLLAAGAYALTHHHNGHNGHNGHSSPDIAGTESDGEMPG